MKMRVCLFLVGITWIVLLVGCGESKGSGYTYGADNINSNQQASGYSIFDKQGDFIYFTNHSCIYEYDMESKKTVQLALNSDSMIWGYIDAHEDYVTYMGSYGMVPAIMRATKDGKESEVIVSVDKELGTPTKPYFEKDWCYSKCDDKFIRTNMVTEEKEVLFELTDFTVMQFLVTEEEYCVVVVPDVASKIYTDLWVSPREKVEFKKIDYYESMGEYIPGLYKFGDVFYLYQVDRNICLMNENFELIGSLPDEIMSDRFFVVDNVIYYRKEGKDTKTVCSYNLETGEKKVLIDAPIDEMNVLENQYVVGLSGATCAYLYDLQTGELVNMLDDEHLMG